MPDGDIDQRIAEALTGAITADETANILAIAEQDFAGLEAAADALDTAALSPLLSMADALAKREAAREMRFRSDRLDAGCSALRARAADLRDAEDRAARKAEREAALTERDTLASDIAERYPAIVRELTKLVQRIDASDARCKALGIESGEAIGRGIPSNFQVSGGPALRLSMAMLPMPTTHETAWGSDTIGGTIRYRGLDA